MERQGEGRGGKGEVGRGGEGEAEESREQGRARRNSRGESDLSLYFLLSAVAAAAVRRAPSKSPHL